MVEYVKAPEYEMEANKLGLSSESIYAIARIYVDHINNNWKDIKRDLIELDINKLNKHKTRFEQYVGANYWLPLLCVEDLISFDCTTSKIRELYRIAESRFGDDSVKAGDPLKSISYLIAIEANELNDSLSKGKPIHKDDFYVLKAIQAIYQINKSNKTINLIHANLNETMRSQIIQQDAGHVAGVDIGIKMLNKNTVNSVFNIMILYLNEHYDFLRYGLINNNTEERKCKACLSPPLRGKEVVYV